MNLSWRRIGRLARVFVAIAAAGALLSIPNVAMGTLPVAETFFASVDQPIGVAASPGELLVTRPYTGNPRQVLSISPTGTVRVFATLPNLPDGLLQREEYLALSPVSADYPNRAAVVDPLLPNRKFPPNEAGFAAGFVYVSQGATIIKVAPDGSAQAQFTILPSCGTTHTGLTFDKVGTFGNNLIATCQNGNVYKVDSAGHAALITTVSGAGGFLEGPEVLPNAGFGRFNGQLLAAAEVPGQVFLVNGDGGTIIANITGAEGVAAIPSTLCSFGASGGAYFSAVYGNGTISVVLKSAFTDPLVGALVRSESVGTQLLSSNGDTLNTTTFSTVTTQHEGASFCVDSVPTDITGFIRREPNDPINPKANGVITVFFFPIPGIFDPFTVTDFRAGITGKEISLKDCQPNPAQGGARICKFFTDKLGIPGPGVYRGLLRFNVVYHGKEGGSDAGGCG